MHNRNKIYSNTARMHSMQNSSNLRKTRKNYRNNSYHSKQNKSRWLISYADIITLLFVFFVVLYGISSLNDDDYQELTDALSRKLAGDKEQIAEDKLAVQRVKVSANSLGKVKQELYENLGGVIDDNMLRITQSRHWLRIDLKDNLRFAPGSYNLDDNSFVILKELAASLNNFENSILVEGYTDNIPFANNKFSSNWQLSAARAASVVEALNTYGIDKQRLAAIGYGPAHPISDNKTKDGRESNRRVSILVNKIDLHAGKEIQDAKNIEYNELDESVKLTARTDNTITKKKFNNKVLVTGINR